MNEPQAGRPHDRIETTAEAEAEHDHRVSESETDSQETASAQESHAHPDRHIAPKPIVSEETTKGTGRLGIIAGIAALVLGLGGLAVYRFLPASLSQGVGLKTGEAVAEGPLKPYAKGAMARLITYATPRPMAAIGIKDADGKAVNLSAYKGRVVVLNIWATWCAPCRTEMPTLGKLQSSFSDTSLKVIPLSVDTPDKLAEARSLIGVHENLSLFTGTMEDAMTKLGIQGMPATLILDKQGREVARLNGEANWDTPEARDLINHLNRL